MQRSESIKELAAALAKAQGDDDRFAESVLAPAMAKTYSPLSPKGQETKSVVERFFEKIVFGSCDCWYWRGAMHKLGYGLMNALGETKAHRIAWMIFNGGIPADMMVLHTCDVRNCVNPEHLFVGTQTENMKDMVSKGRGRVVPMPGEANPQSKLTRDDVEEMKRLRATGMTFAAIAELFGVVTMTAHRAITGGTWK